MVRYLNKILGIYVFLTLGMAVLMSVIISPPHHTTAQTLESILQERSASKNNPQIKLGPFPSDIAISMGLNKVYVTDSSSNTVSIIDSNSGNITRNIRVGDGPEAIAVDDFSNKVYVANHASSSVSVIDGFNDKKEPNDIRVGDGPIAMAIEHNKVYVANMYSNTISVINETTDKKEPNDIRVGDGPRAMSIGRGVVEVANLFGNTISVINETTDKKEPNDIRVGDGPIAMLSSVETNKTYVANSNSGTVSVINETTDKKEPNDIRVGDGPEGLSDSPLGKIYVANYDSGTVSVINETTDKKEPNDIRVGNSPNDIVEATALRKMYVTNSGSDSVSVIDETTDKKEPNDIRVGNTSFAQSKILSNDFTGILYVLNAETVSTIKSSDDKVAAGINFNISPGNSGNILCNTQQNPNSYNTTYPTNTYLYVEAGIKCYAKPNKDFEFSSWVQSLGHNSTITLNTTSTSDSPWNSILSFLGLGPNDPSATFDVNAYGTFTANFKPLPPPVPPEYWASLFTVVATALVGSLLIPAAIGWFKSKRQTSKLNSYHREINLFGKGNAEQLNKSHNMIVNAYSEGKINNEQYTNLKTEISILYEEIYKKQIDSTNGNGLLLGKVKDDINNVYAQEKLSEKHYKLLLERISDSINKQ